MDQRYECLDGNEAAARVAYAVSEVISIYPITPASPMAEHCDDWSAARRPNLWGKVPDVVEMQSEAGAAGALHGALQKGALGTTFTASQGLLLMIPNMFKIAGELTPAVIHVAARTVATHALSIFGDHSDVMHARTTGWAMLAAGSVQEAHDFALVAHAATLRARIPFLHFFDGFRTSHEINKIAVLEEDDIRALVRDDDVLAFRARGMTPDAPVVRGTAQNPDVFFQAREASNPFHLAVPGIVQEVMDELAARTGRRYGLVDYHGAPDADRVVVVMGSAGGAVEETVDALVAAGEKVGMLRIRLFQPFPAEQVMAALPPTVRAIAVLDRTKEPGSVGEPLYLAIVAALAEAMDGDAPPFATAPRVIGGRYGLSSKEMTPSMIKPIFDELSAARPKRHFTVGIYDDVTHLSLPIDGEFRHPRPAGEVQAVFFGLGSDGTVGANKASIKIIGESTDLFAQGYFVYDSKKSGSVTVSHLRFGPEPIRSTYLVEDADFVACHQFGLLGKTKVLESAKHGATFLLNAPYGPDEVWDHLPGGVQQLLIDKEIDFWVIDALAVADEAGMGSRINTVMQPCFFQLAGILPADEAITRIKGFVEKTYAKRGEATVARNFAAIDHSLERLAHVPLGGVTNGRATTPPVPDDVPDFVARITSRLIAGDGDLLPVSALPVDGTFPTGTTKYEKRAIAQMIPIWDPAICIDCGKCAMVCPHATIRMKVFPTSAVEAAPADFLHKEFRSRDLLDHRLTIQVAPDDCTGCGVCVDVCPAKSKTDTSHKAINMEPVADHRDVERPRWDFFQSIAPLDRSLDPARFGQGLADAGAAVRVLGRLRRLRRDAIHPPRQPALRRPDDRRQRDRLLVDLRRQPADDPVDGQRGRSRPGLEQLAVRGQRRVRPRDAARPRRPDRPRATARRTPRPGARRGPRRRTARRRPGHGGRDRPPARAGEPPARRARRARRPTRVRRPTPACPRRAISFARASGSSAVTAGPTTSASVASTRSSRPVATSTSWSSTPRSTRTPAARPRRRPRAAPSPSSPPPARARPRRTSARSPARTATSTSPRSSMGANDLQTTKALLEADAWPGPSLVIAYSTCIAHGIDMSKSMTHQKDAVKSGYWPLYRFHPSEIEGGKPFKLDSATPIDPDRRLRGDRDALRRPPADPSGTGGRAGGPCPGRRRRALALLRTARGHRTHRSPRPSTRPRDRARRRERRGLPLRGRRGRGMTVDLRTRYLGLELRSPIVASAAPHNGETGDGRRVSRPRASGRSSSLRCSRRRS